ncbi:unnamed protein product, partial [Mycena citricolor]
TISGEWGPVGMMVRMLCLGFSKRIWDFEGASRLDDIAWQSFVKSCFRRIGGKVHRDRRFPSCIFDSCIQIKRLRESGSGGNRLKRVHAASEDDDD